MIHADQPPEGWDYARHIDAAGAEIARFAEVVRGVDLAVGVPTCPGWTLAKLIKHAGSIHRWAERMVRERTAERIDPRQVDLGLPAATAGYPDWLAAGAPPLLATLRTVDPETPMWAWGADQHARFWARRMLHETTIHRADAELALGRAPSIDPAVAVDGIDELLDNLPGAAYFAPRVAELRGSGESLHFHCTDGNLGAAGEWTIRLGADGFTWTHEHGKAAVAVRASAGELELLLYGRLRADDPRFQRFGDEAPLSRWLENSAL
ncbi:MAG: maleylpyruvate isomerase family mycothiol-dependent enzyme [Chloroflexota bacterium]